MKAIALVPGTRELALVERPEPTLAADDQLKVRVLDVGICGTDREEAAGGRARAPDGSRQLVLGHEMLGEVVETGKAVTRFKPGDLAVVTVRRGCGQCVPCRMGRPDMCRTGMYREHGIWGLDGFQCEFVVDEEAWTVPAPACLRDTGVLTEPLSVVEKAIDVAVRVQVSRLPDAGARPLWLHGRRCLVAGLGPVGLLASMALVLRGAVVYGLDIVDAGSARPKWLEQIGGHYIDGRQVKVDRVGAQIGLMDVIVEATGVASIEFNLLDALAPDGAYVLTGLPGGDRPIEIEAAELVRRLVLNNQAMIGSVNEALDHTRMAVDDLANAVRTWGDHVGRLITHRYTPDQFQAAFTVHDPDEIKAVIEWAR